VAPTPAIVLPWPSITTLVRIRAGHTSWDHTNRCGLINVNHGGKYPLKIDRFRKCWPYAGTWEAVLPRTEIEGD